MTRAPGGGLLGKLLAAVRGRDSAAGDESAAGEDEPRDAGRRIDAARERLKAEIPPPED